MLKQEDMSGKVMGYNPCAREKFIIKKHPPYMYLYDHLPVELVH